MPIARSVQPCALVTDSPAPPLSVYFNNKQNVLVEKMFVSNHQPSMIELKIDVFFNIFLEVCI